MLHFHLQQDFFDRHLRLSQERDLPFIVHMRDCQSDILEMLYEAAGRGPLCGVMHSFTGDREMAEKCLDMGLYISFAGMVTFKKSDSLRAVATVIPDDRILIETDSPYLAPEPVRGNGQTNPLIWSTQDNAWLRNAASSLKHSPIKPPGMPNACSKKWWTSHRNGETYSCTFAT